MSELDETKTNKPDPEREFVNQEDMTAISQAKNRLALAVSEAEKAAANAKIADLEYRSTVQHIFIKYNMAITDRIDDSTGEIFRGPDESAAESDSE